MHQLCENRSDFALRCPKWAKKCFAANARGKKK
jgi:hypothetical protein